LKSSQSKMRTFFDHEAPYLRSRRDQGYRNAVRLASKEKEDNQQQGA